MASGQAVRASESSFIHTARRDQLVGHAIELIAQLGGERASTVKLAQRAGVSRGVVTYHFRDLADLHGAVVAEVYRVGGEVLREPVATAATPRDALLTFVGGSVDFYAEYPKHILALHEIFRVARRSEAGSREAADPHRRELDDLGVVLQSGQEQRQFRDFDPMSMSRMIRGVLDTAIACATDPDCDVGALREEIVATVDAMTRAKGVRR